MLVLLSALRWTPPLVVPAIFLAICAVAGVDLDTALPWTFGNKVWRLGNLLDVVTLLATMAEMALAVQINSAGQTLAILGMVVPRAILGAIIYLAPACFPDPHAVVLLVAAIIAPGLAGLVRVSVARRDISVAR